MSTLTKILIVLLTLSSIFLCGVVVTYVANADNYKQLYDSERAEKDAALAKGNRANLQLDEKKKEYQRQADELTGKIASLNQQILTLRNEFNDVKRDKTDLEKKVQSWVSMTNELVKTNDDQRQLLENTLTELKQVKAKQIEQREQLDETVAELIRKNAIIETLTIDKKRLEEKAHQLQKQLDRLRLPVGKETVPVAPVTPDKVPGRPAPPARDIGLKGLITAVDLKYSLAELSVGAARGVEEGMRFYVTRADKFICEILVFDVDAERAVGILERIQYEPKVGDNVSTNL